MNYEDIKTNYDYVKVLGEMMHDYCKNEKKINFLAYENKRFTNKGMQFLQQNLHTNYVGKKKEMEEFLGEKRKLKLEEKKGNITDAKNYK